MKSIKEIGSDIVSSLFAIIISISILACVAIPILLIIFIFKLLMS